jgi:predicted nucleotidyltransferase
MRTRRKQGVATASLIRRMVRRMVEQFHPEQVILFGSYARGDARPDSDVD